MTTFYDFSVQLLPHLLTLSIYHFHHP